MNAAPTPDGRYLIVKQRLWRAADPGLSADRRDALVHELMDARRAVRAAGDDAAALRRARGRVHAAKVALGERGPVWWSDGAPDYHRYLVKNTPYAAWFAGLRSRSGGPPARPARSDAAQTGRP